MIHGVLAPKFIGNIDTTQDEVLLDYWVTLKDEPEPKTYGVKAVRTGKRVFTNVGKHWIFQGRVHLWKYADPIAKYLELKSHEGKAVHLYRFRDGETFKNADDEIVPFIITSIKEFYLGNKNELDSVDITFRSTDFITTPVIQVAPVIPTALTKLFAEGMDTNSYRTWTAEEGVSANLDSLDSFNDVTVVTSAIGTRNAIKYRGTSRYHVWNSALISGNNNYLIFYVGKMGGTSGGNICDFRAVGEYRLIISARAVNNNRLRYLWGVSSDTYEDVMSFDSSSYALRCYRLEEGLQKIYVGGGIAKLARTNDWTPTSLTSKLAFGGSASSSSGNEQFIAHLSIYSVPEGNGFTASVINAIAQEIVAYYNDPLITWTNISD